MNIRILLIIGALVFVSNINAQDRNVLFIAVDDLKPLIGAYGDKMAITPNMDRLAKMGVTFTNAHCQQAVCAPSRASLLTGMRPDVTEVWDLKTQIRDQNPNIVTLPQYFKEQGYTTAGIGKIFDPRSVDKELDAPSWSEPFMKVKVDHKEFGIPELGRYQSAENKRIYADLRSSSDAPKKNIQKYLNEHRKPSTESVDISDDGYHDGKMTDIAIDRLGDLADGTKPFFLTVGYKKPHLPFVAPSKYWDLYSRKDMPLATYQDRAKGTIKLSYHNMGELKSYTDIPNDFTETGGLSEDKQRELIHGYYACISYIDAQIGKLLDAIENEGLSENTSIILWGDHGWHLGDHGLWNKHSNFEQATRSPLIIADPSMKQGDCNGSSVEFVDIFPTLCDLTGLEQPKHLQGVSLVPILTGKKKKVKDFAISQYHRGKHMGYALRNERYRYVVWYQDARGKDPLQSKILAKELYDYKKDPQETLNKVNQDPELVKDLQKQLDEFLVRQEKERIAYNNNSTVGSNNNSSIRSIIESSYQKPIYVGATIGHAQVNTPVEKLLTDNFNYTVPENAVKQAVVHPEPGVWKWGRIDKIMQLAEKHEIIVRLHGPISPQASKWAKDDSRTGEELLSMMTEYMIRQCKKFNGHPNVKWMDVVNETVKRNGTWFGPKEGVGEWENPWTIIGSDTDVNKTPIYISRAFELANKHAPDIRQVYNHHGGMEPVMWDRVKETVLYLRAKGLRVDGIGWQAHLRNKGPQMLEEEDYTYLASLVDWAHANDLEFHVTEIDYKIKESNDISLKRQADAYARVLDILLSRKENGVVTYNTWGLVDGVGKHTNLSRFVFDKEGNAKPAYFALRDIVVKYGK